MAQVVILMNYQQQIMLEYYARAVGIPKSMPASP